MLCVFYLNKSVRNYIDITQNTITGKTSLSPLRLFRKVFTALHGMQTRSSDDNSVHPSVCPSVSQTRDL